MSDELHAAIRALQSSDEITARQGFAFIVDMARLEPDECAAELSRAILAERNAGAFRTPRLITLLGLTRVPAQECLPVCLDLLRILGATEAGPPADAALGAAAIVAQTQPRSLLPDLASDPQAIDNDVVPALLSLLSITSEFLRELPESAVTDMARRLWRDCAAFDLMTLVDFAGVHVERSSQDDAIVGLIVDLIERMPASADEKHYAGQRLQEVGANATAIERIQRAWRAIRVAPRPADGPAMVEDPEPPMPDPRVDEWLIEFSDGDEARIELARAALDTMFEDTRLPDALPWWIVVTVDAVPLQRRRMEVRWVLLRFAALLGRGRRMPTVPPSVLIRWLDAPQLLNERDTQTVLLLLSRQQPAIVVRHCLYRAVTAVGATDPGAAAVETWRALAAAEPSAVLLAASRWIAFGCGKSAVLDLLIEVLNERMRAQPTRIDALTSALEPDADTPVAVIEVARKILEELRKPLQEDRQS